MDAAAEMETAILDSIERWLARDVRAHVRQMDHDDEYPHAWVEDMKNLGLFGATIGQEWGGLGLSAVTYARIVEKVAETWMSLSGIFNSHLILAACIERNGTQEQKERYLPRLARGELRGGLALTEPDAGTDLQAIRTRAVRDGDAYVLNGSKTWISNGVYGTIFALLAKTDIAAEPRHKGMSMFIAEKGPGFTVSKKFEKLGYKGIDSAEFSLQDYRVPVENLLGGAEGHGMQAALGGLELGRINVAARGCALAAASLNESLRYSQIRKTFGKPICQHQAIQLKLGEMGTRLEAARLLTYNAARMYDSGQRCDMEAGMAKYFASEAAVANSLEAMRIHGGYSYSKEFNVERYFRDAPLMCIGEGTNEIQRMLIAKHLIERNKVT